jgi:serine/threonine protein kinase
VRDLVEAALTIRPEARTDFIRNASQGNETLSDEALRVIETVSRSNDDSRTVLTPAESRARLRDMFPLGDEDDTDRNVRASSRRRSMSSFDLNKDQWQQLKPLLTRALKLSASERLALFERELSDEALRAYGLHLLQYYDRASKPLVSAADGSTNGLAGMEVGVEGAIDLKAIGEHYEGKPRFNIRARLGAGGFGSVYEAYDRKQKRVVALKVLRRQQFVDRFKRELRALVDVRHPNLIELYELFCEGSTWFFTMELIHGVDFLTYVEHRRGKQTTPACNLERLRSAAQQLAQAIRALHQRGILHRDIKPGNVLVSVDGRVRLLDFGLVREMERSGTLSLLWIGTPAYMAPEQFAGQTAQQATDWYSFGVMLFEAVVGLLPRDCSPDLDAPAVFPTGTPDDLRQLCRELLRSEPRDRPSGSEVIQRLGAPVVSLERTSIDDVDTDTLVGREPHLQQLQHLLERAAEGRSVIANVHGSSGIGKSTLLRSFRRRVASTDPRVVILAGRCYQNETIPYKALDDLVDSLAHYLRTLSDLETEALTPHGVEYLVRIFPVLRMVDGLSRVRRKAIDILDSAELRERAFVSLQDLFLRLSQRRLMLITIDDLQWGDLDSAAFLRRLLCADEPPSMLLIASYRAEEVETSAFLQSWRSLLAASKAEVSDVTLEPLSHAESMELLSRLLPAGDIATTRIDAIAAESEGSPFLIDQLARHPILSEEDIGAVPNIVQVIKERLAALPATAEQLLEVIAVAGQPISFQTANIAAGLDPDDALAVSSLVADHLVRIRSFDRTQEVESYHDRIREAVVVSMTSERRKGRHLELARALEMAEAPDAALIATHLVGAEEFERAAHYGVIAGNRAAQMLAFDRAANWYRLAIAHWTRTRTDLARVRRQLGDVLALGGQGEQAAGAYLDAAVDAPSTERFELKRLAAEQWLRIGRVEEGLGLLNAVAKELGIWIPSRRWLTMTSLAWHRFRIAARRLDREDEPPANVPIQTLIKLDVYWSLVVGFATLDVARFVEFHARHLLLAIRSGDRDRAAMSLAAEAALRAGRLGANPVVDRLLAKAEGWSTNSTHPQAVGSIAVMKAFSSLLVGAWRNAEEQAERNEALLRERCTGVAWELSTNELVRTTAIAQMGRWSKLGNPLKRIEQVEEAAKRLDAHAVEALTGAMSVTGLAADRPDLSVRFDQLAQDALPSSSEKRKYFLPQLWILHSRVDAALYQQRPAVAWELVSVDWPALSKSWHFRLLYVLMFAHFLRGRAALANAAAESSDRRSFLREASESAKQLERNRLATARMYSQILRAGIAAIQGHMSGAAQYLESAERLAEDNSMALFAAICNHRVAVLRDGLSDAGLSAKCEAWAKAEEIVRPHRLLDVYTPGCSADHS